MGFRQAGKSLLNVGNSISWNIRKCLLHLHHISLVQYNVKIAVLCTFEEATLRIIVWLELGLESSCYWQNQSLRPSSFVRAVSNFVLTSVMNRSSL